jgi:hypothetical protein
LVESDNRSEIIATPSPHIPKRLTNYQRLAASHRAFVAQRTLVSTLFLLRTRGSLLFGLASANAEAEATATALASTITMQHGAAERRG